jgi:hypothetical protein
LLGGVFEGRGPAGGTGGEAEGHALVKVEDLDDSAIGAMAEVVALDIELADSGENFLESFDVPDGGVAGDLEAFEKFSEVVLGLHVGALVIAEAVGEEGERTGGNGPWVERFQGAGSGVARVSEGIETFLVTLLVEPGEALGGHEDFTTDFEKRRSVFESEGDVPDGADVLGNIVPTGAIAAGEGVFESAVAIDERTGDAVDFWFDGERDGFECEAFLEALEKFGDFFFVEEVVDGKHGEEMRALLKGIKRCAADALGGGIGIVKFGMGFFEIFKFAEKTVVSGVRDFGFRVLVVELIMAREFRAEFSDTVVEKHAKG